ncbi:MAG: hypothetical protein ABSB13_07510 [Candidatus Binatus sp.]|jgi:hypothetical protein|uniref:hypothetical protein n=1 Tax=Candidatus Binatus sp. TaxID=2811406 RepID=UPI003D0DA07A
MHTRSFAIVRSMALPVVIASLLMLGWLSAAQCQEPENAAEPQKIQRPFPDLNGTWTGSTTGKTGHPEVCGTEDLSMTLDQVTGDSTFTGSYVQGPSAECGGGSGSLTGSVTRKGVVKITLDTPGSKNPDCTADMRGHVDDAVTEITGSFKLSSKCKEGERGGTGSFDASL